MGIASAVDADLDVLTELNLGYVRSVQESDVAWFAEMLAEDFLCTSSDGSLLDRAAFLEHTGHTVSISGLEAHNVNVRLFGVSRSSTPARRSGTRTAAPGPLVTPTSGRSGAAAGSPSPPR